MQRLTLKRSDVLGTGSVKIDGKISNAWEVIDFRTDLPSGYIDRGVATHLLGHGSVAVIQEIHEGIYYYTPTPEFIDGEEK